MKVMFIPSRAVPFNPDLRKEWMSQQFTLPQGCGIINWANEDIEMKSYKVNLELFDKAVHREYRIIQRFFDMLSDADEYSISEE